MKEIQFNLTEPLQYQDQGQVLDTNYLTLIAPSAAMIRQTSIIKNLFFESIRLISKDVEKEKNIDKSVNPQEAFNSIMVQMVLSMSPNFEKIANAFKELACLGTVKLPTGIKVTSFILDKMSLADFEAMLGEYLANFLIGSSLQKMSQM